MAADVEEVVESGATDGFGGLGLDAGLIKTLSDLGYEEPTPIQRETIPPLLAGRDLIGQAATGTGKTAAFALPILQRIAAAGKDRPRPSALVLVPTRELAMQVAEAMHKYGNRLKVTTIPIYGGHSFGQQAQALQRGVDVVVATPGRAVDHIGRKTMNLSGISVLALDEADEMLDMGFADDLETILSATPETRQTIFFSATLPPRIAGMAKRYLRDPLRIHIEQEKPTKGIAPKVRQTAYIIPRSRKLEVLGRVLDMEDPRSALIFCRTRTEVDSLTERLNAHGYRAQSLHGGITQDQRSRVIKRLKDGAIDLVVATDVAARGLDIENLALVVNYDVPANPDAYVHRIGRVGRAGREGVAVTLVDPRESRLLGQFARQAGGRIETALVPTVTDLRAKRLELTRAAIREAILAGGLDRYRVAVESLAQEHDLMTVALACVKLAHKAAGGDRDDGEDGDPSRPSGPTGGKSGGAKPASARTTAASPGSAAPVEEEPAAAMSRLYVGVGRTDGILPQHIIAAITGLTGIMGEQIGTVEIADRHSVVEVPESLVEKVIYGMRKCRIRGRKAAVRRFLDNRQP
ncbi:DEAD/DEAH box helicase [Humisphaera borealis]|uniref:DEAD-box ATP-dependent RNA helicase RhpA n=1 Tax=Humisphaera borealis TaxID=2807512 RepID=A0A7M2WY33_9BACT|nr:DEAD/DEAH box helicase [Humisphaera borealis]QOV89721.1 DEAD/DEAH box helicase [Humisphaera borealis]